MKMKPHTKAVFLLLIFMFLLVSFLEGKSCRQSILRFDVVDKRTDSIDQKIKASIEVKFRNAIFNKIVKPDLSKLEKNAAQKYGEVGEEVIWNLIALYHYIDFNRSKQIMSQSEWVEYKNKINAKYPNATDALTLNNDGWFLFETTNDRKQLETALFWSRRAVEKQPEVGNWLDTYANLLYKLGRKKEAIEKEKKALELDPQNQDIKTNLEKMRSDIPTWPAKEPKN